MLHLSKLFPLNITPDAEMSNISYKKCYIKLVDFVKFHEKYTKDETLKTVKVLDFDKTTGNFVTMKNFYDKKVAAICITEEFKNGRKIKENQKLYECNHCPKKYKRKSSIRLHMKCHVSNNERNKVSRNIKQHETATKPSKAEKPECKVCNRIYSNRQSLRKHTKRKHICDEEKPYTCDPCGKRFVILQDLRSHMFTHLSEETRNDLRIYKCAVCERKYLHKISLRQHLRYEHLKMKLQKVKQKHKCDICSRVYNLKTNLRRHQRDVHNKNDLAQWKCSICQKAYANKHYLRAHVLKQHIRNESFACDICGRTYATRASFQKHQRISHGNQRSFKCFTCQKVYPGKENLKNHIKQMHLKTEHVVCDICGCEFFTKGNLRQHMQNHHMKHAFKCEYCPKTFAFADRLKDHTTTHTGIRKFCCPYCFIKRFKTRSDLCSHFKKAHLKEWKKDKAKYGSNVSHVLKCKKAEC